MFDEWDGLGPRAALAAVVERRRSADVAEAELLGLAAHWADLHAVLPGEGVRVAVPGMERLIRLAGPGTPEVAEFAPAELGAALRCSTFAAGCLIGDALELRHRLPRLWARIGEGTLPAWRGRKIAEHTKVLSAEAAAWVDAQVVGFAHKIGMKRVLDLVAAALWRFDPAAAAARVKAAREGRGVFVGEEMTNGTRSISIEADALDVAEFDATISAIAEALAALGDQDRVNVRRAKAIGVIADPQGTLDLLSGDGEGAGNQTGGETGAASGDGSHAGGPGGEQDSGAATDECDAACKTDGETGSGRSQGSHPGSGRRGAAGRAGRRRARGGKPVLYIHLHADAVAEHGGAAMARVEGGGPVTAEQVMGWLGRTDMRVQPVLDLADTTSVDAYEAPARTDEVVVLRNPCCPFPWCNNLSRNKDTDHIDSYVPPEEGGPPGQTAPDKLAKPCRRHHRLKTHGGWSYKMPEPGIYLWRSPLGQRYLVDHTGTTNLTSPADGVYADTA